MEAIIEALSTLYEWFAGGIYEFVVEAYAWVSIKAMTFWVQALLWKLQFVWDVGGAVIRQLGIADEINARMASLPPDAAALVSYAKIPEALNMIANAGMARVLLRFWS